MIMLKTSEKLKINFTENVHVYFCPQRACYYYVR